MTLMVEITACIIVPRSITFPRTNKIRANNRTGNVDSRSHLHSVQNVSENSNTGLFQNLRSVVENSINAGELCTKYLKRINNNNLNSNTNNERMFDTRFKKFPPARPFRHRFRTEWLTKAAAWMKSPSRSEPRLDPGPPSWCKYILLRPLEFFSSFLYASCHPPPIPTPLTCSPRLLMLLSLSAFVPWRESNGLLKLLSSDSAPESDALSAAGSRCRVSSSQGWFCCFSGTLNMLPKFEISMLPVSGSFS
ncbi:RNA-directed DNA polymerase (reversetranscriptase)-related family protein [Striga asiatica]|uniref:RNA-directed DNA polymerase (Reversetranscriptase)-related family protein n=1 Tax=Striga asiatica TaxID=4170 RepID=A0A5A7P942_STRAF|nr:RNA-directed DNA polymerase (reversetranscriptase)-related family protein [Striga asiatica]